MAGLMNQQHVSTLPIRSPLNEDSLGSTIRVDEQIQACSDWLRATKRDAILLFISVYHPALNVGLALTWTIDQFQNLLLRNVFPTDLRRAMHRFSVDHGLPMPTVKPPPLPPQALLTQRPAEPLPVRASCDHETPKPRLSVSIRLSALALAGLLFVGLVSFAQYRLDEVPAPQPLPLPLQQADAGYAHLIDQIQVQEILGPPSEKVLKPAPSIKKPKRRRHSRGAGPLSGVVKIGEPIKTLALITAEPSSDGAAKIVPVETYKCVCPGRRVIMIRFQGPPPRKGTPEAEELAKKAEIRCNEIANQSQ